jgi:predicted PurR-regulated permease PerM
MKALAIRSASYLIAAALLLLTVLLHLVSALFAGMLVYTLIDRLSPLLARRIAGRNAQVLVTAVIATLAVALVGLATAAILFYLRDSEAAGLQRLWAKLAEIVGDANTILPPSVIDRLPDSADELRTVVVGWLNEHGSELQNVGKAIGVALVHVLIGGIIGAMVAVSRTGQAPDRQPLAALLTMRVDTFYDAFGRVVIGQGKISLINTLLTAIYLLLVLPLGGIHLPLVKTMLAVTLIVGILPVVGNLISNTVIVIVSASVSFSAAIASLVFLVLLHKGEYFLSARILGHQIRAHAWEMLLAMLVMEAAFGVSGIAVAPVFYAYLKAELARAELI